MKRLLFSLFSSLLFAGAIAPLAQAAPVRSLSQSTDSTVSQMSPESSPNQRSDSSLQQRRQDQLNDNGGRENGSLDLSPAVAPDKIGSPRVNPQMSMRGRGGTYPAGYGQPSLLQQRRLLRLEHDS